ncbi:MAG: PAS domain S-box protein [Chloroflexi bacterium]|nr:MAG: PAS domain S-box protein [Chloroflexota bacterium]
MNMRRFISALWPTGQQLSFLVADEQQRVAGILFPLLSILTVVSTVFALVIPFLYNVPQIPTLAALVMTVTFASGAWLLRRNNVKIAGWLVCGVLWLVVTTTAMFTGGVRSSASLHYVIVMLLAGVSFGRRGALTTALINTLTLVVLWFLETNSMLPPDSALLATPLAHTIMLGTIFILIGLILSIVDVQLSAALKGVRDEMSERRYAEQSLHFALLAARAGAWEWDASARTIRWSEENYPLLGLVPGKDRLTYRTWRERIHPADQARLQAVVDHAISEQRNFEVEFRVVLPDGSIRWLLGVGQPIRNADGSLRGIAGLQIDITARKQIEAELERSELYYRSLVEDLPAMVCRFRPDGTLTFVNQLYCEAFKRSRAELIGFNFYDLIPPSQRAAVAAGIAQLSVAQPVMVHEHEVIHPDGSIGWQRWINRLLLTTDSEPVEYQALGIDITDRKRAEIEREQLIAELAARNEALEQFSYTVSHDLKSPLITIKGFAGYIQQDLRAGKLDRIPNDLQRIIDAADRMHQLLENLLHLAQTGRQLSASERMKLSVLIGEAAAAVSARLAERNVLLHVPPNLPEVLGDRTRLREVFQNLLDNAAKFMGDQPSPQIWIEAQPAETPGFVLVSVRDNGIGIDPRHHQRIFGLFERLDQRIEGTGIGLTLVRKIVEAHGGKIWVRSNGLGQGTTFYLTLPAALPLVNEDHLP